MVIKVMKNITFVLIISKLLLGCTTATKAPQQRESNVVIIEPKFISIENKDNEEFSFDWVLEDVKNPP